MPREDTMALLFMMGLPSNALPPQRANLGDVFWASLIKPDITELPSRPIPSSSLAVASIR